MIIVTRRARLTLIYLCRYGYAGPCCLYRYPILLLVGGGIGITPVMGMLKDIYDYNLAPSRSSSVPHAIQAVYFMWVMPVSADYESFRAEVDILIKRAGEEGKPKLIPRIFITKSKESLQAPFSSGRPKIQKIFDDMMSSYPTKAGLVFACGPGPMVAELWDHSVRATLNGNRIDFHHEVFDF